MLKSSFKICSLLTRQTKTAIPICSPLQLIRLASSEVKSNEHNEKIYYGPLTRQIRAVKIFSITSSILGVAVQPMLYKELVALDSVSLVVAAYSFVGFFTLVTPILLHLITKKYVSSMEYDKANDVYVAVTYNFFCVPKELRFRIEDVKVPDVPGMFTSIIAKGKPLFIDPSQFSETRHYAKIMGFDKPMDFKLYQNQVAEEKGDK